MRLTNHFRNLLLSGSVALISTVTIAIAGCGGGSSSSSQTNFRAINTISDGGNATIQVNNGSSTGSQAFDATSSYSNISSGSQSFGFTLSAFSGTSYQTFSENVSSGSYYSAILFGRADITSGLDPRFPTLEVVPDDKSSPPSGDARIRIVNAAPDGQTVDAYVNGSVIDTSIKYLDVSSYFDVPAGSVTLNLTATGTQNSVVAPTTLSLSSGQIYTALLVEPTINPVTFTTTLVSDGS